MIRSPTVQVFYIKFVFHRGGAVFSDSPHNAIGSPVSSVFLCAPSVSVGDLCSGHRDSHLVAIQELGADFHTDVQPCLDDQCLVHLSCLD